jgi:hypothetical protein
MATYIVTNAMKRWRIVVFVANVWEILDVYRLGKVVPISKESGVTKKQKKNHPKW